MQRSTLADYERFIYGLCGLPPGEDRDRCAQGMVRRLASMYGEHGLAPPPGLQALAEKLGVDLNATGR